MEEKSLKKRIRSGEIRRRDVISRLAELAFGKANDCVKLVTEEMPELGKLDLSLLREVKRSDKGGVEVKLVDRLQALALLIQLAEDGGEDVESFLQAQQETGEETS